MRPVQSHERRETIVADRAPPRADLVEVVPLLVSASQTNIRKKRRGRLRLRRFWRPPPDQLIASAIAASGSAEAGACRTGRASDLGAATGGTFGTKETIVPVKAKPSYRESLVRRVASQVCAFDPHALAGSQEQIGESGRCRLGDDEGSAVSARSRREYRS